LIKLYPFFKIITSIQYLQYFGRNGEVFSCVFVRYAKIYLTWNYVIRFKNQDTIYGENFIKLCPTCICGFISLTPFRSLLKKSKSWRSWIKKWQSWKN
jgi:hypothetical protein